ncbi:TPA: hypothetical protein N0F65_003953 [Lagenidium giganteum]|uniref:t-SNARE coiled-coil homology domain-containing protein n=1 Tax=Lagenidium giganteum TaxID=4803 RepID=A0AAV2YU55_9STRA|nr:TPA: hypothetical protein N0F65_003953 [Lagenidium giganteum]
MARDNEDIGSGDYEDASTPKMEVRIAKSTQEQERQLDDLHAGVKRLKEHAIAANTEVQEQNQIIDEIAINMEDTERAVQQQTAVAKKVVKKHRELCGYYILIIILVIGLIVVLSI